MDGPKNKTTGRGPGGSEDTLVVSNGPQHNSGSIPEQVIWEQGVRVLSPAERNRRNRYARQVAQMETRKAVSDTAFVDSPAAANRARIARFQDEERRTRRAFAPITLKVLS
jgi:hypothetical protein